MEFTDKVFENIHGKKVMFAVPSDNGRMEYVFSRVPSLVGNVDIVMVGEYKGDGLVSEMTPFCYVLGDRIFHCAYIYGIDEHFVEKSQKEFSDICVELRRKICDGLSRVLDSFSDEELVPDASARKSMLDPVAVKRSIYGALLSGEEPVFEISDSVYGDNFSVLRYIADGDVFVDGEVKKILDDGVLGLSVKDIKKDYLRYRAARAFFGSYRLDENDVAFIRISAILAGLIHKGARHCRLYVDGRNDMITDGWDDIVQRGGYSIDGLELVVRANVDSFVGNDTGRFPWFTLRCENYTIQGSRDFLTIYAKDVKKITYHGKVVYSRLSETPKVVKEAV